MNQAKRVIKDIVVIALTYVLCASSFLQPVVAYAVAMRSQQAASEAIDSKTAGGETLDAGDEQSLSVLSSSDSKANSWRYQNGELRSDLQDDYATDLGVESRSMHSMPTGATAQGIDVSGYQKNVDWQKVKDAGIDFAILKIGNVAAWDPDGWYTDSRFQRNMSECERLGIPYGVYVYSYAMNTREAVNGANQIIALLKGHNPTLPVYLDLEDDSTLTYKDGYKPVQSNHGENMKHADYDASRVSQAAIATAFCNTISAAGYTPGVYSGASWFKNFLTDPCFSNSGWSIWTAQYWYGQSYNPSIGDEPEYPAEYDCWQYSSLSTVPGVNGYCDINYWYAEKPTTNKDPHGEFPEDSVFERVSGQTRYQTAYQLASQCEFASDTVVIASGEAFPDALSASALAGAEGAPILLTGRQNLSAEVKSYIEEHGIKKAFIVGESQAISNDVQTSIEGLGVEVTRVGGATRQDTALAVARKVGEIAGAPAHVIVASSSAPWDSLSVSPYAYGERAPIILAQGDGTLSQDAISMIRNLAPSGGVIIVGGPAAVSSFAESQLSGISVERWYGKTRYETSLAIAENTGYSSENVAIASGENYPDALVSGPVVGSVKGVLLLTPSKNADPLKKWLVSNSATMKKCQIVGGASAVSSQAYGDIAWALGVS